MSDATFQTDITVPVLSLITVPSVQLPPYVLQAYHDNEKHDLHYAQLLEHTPFHDYVMDYDGVKSHVLTPIAGDEDHNLYCALDAIDIRDIFENLHNENPEHTIEEFLLDIVKRDGFIILMDDQGKAWVYVKDLHAYHVWLCFGVEHGKSSFSYF